MINFTGSVTNYAKQQQLLNKVSTLKANGFANTEKEQKASTNLVSSMQEELIESNKKSKIQSIYAKVQNGENLTEDEERELQAHDEKFYQEYKMQKVEQEAYENALKNCRTKDEAERLQMAKLSQNLSKMKAIDSNANITKEEKLKQMQLIAGDTARSVAIYREFTKSDEYKNLKTEREEEDERIEAKKQEESENTDKIDANENKEENVVSDKDKNNEQISKKAEMSVEPFFVKRENAYKNAVKFTEIKPVKVEFDEKTTEMQIKLILKKNQDDKD